MNEDEYRDNQLNKHLADQEMAELVSSCCGAPLKENTALCSDCKEHCSEVEMGEYMYEERESAMCDKADSERELQRELENV